VSHNHKKLLVARHVYLQVLLLALSVLRRINKSSKQLVLWSRHTGSALPKQQSLVGHATLAQFFLAQSEQTSLARRCVDIGTPKELARSSQLVQVSDSTIEQQTTASANKSGLASHATGTHAHLPGSHLLDGGLETLAIDLPAFPQLLQYTTHIGFGVPSVLGAQFLLR
jgi:hypothetical protein